MTVSTVNVMPTATVFEIGGLGWETLDQDIMASTMGGLLDNGSNTFVNIPWNGLLGTIGESVNTVSDALYAELVSTPGPKIAVGLSGSTMAINEVMRRLDAQRAIDPTSVPSPEDVSFIVMGDAERGILPALVPFFGATIPGINYTVRPIPVTAYDVTVVKGEYDGAADWPDRPWNLLAVANALAGSGAFEGPDGEEIFGSIHFDAIFTDPSGVPAQNITRTVNAAGGVTTTYLIPTPNLPILLPLLANGVPQSTVDVLNAVLKPVVDSAYKRNDRLPAFLEALLPKSQTAQAVKATATTETAVAAPSVEATAVKEPAVKEPAIKEPAIQETAIQEPAVKKQAIQETAVKEPAEKPAPARATPARPSTRSSAAKETTPRPSAAKATAGRATSR
jgi:hypothetical protein